MDEWLKTKALPVHLASACGLVHKEGKVLLVKTKQRGWEIPGGVVEQGETVTEGLVREIYEESGITAEPLYPAAVFQRLEQKDGYGPLEGVKLPPVINFAFVCRYMNGQERSSDETEDVRWVTAEEAVSMVTHPMQKKVLDRLLAADGSFCFSAFRGKGENVCFLPDVLLSRQPEI